MLSEELFEYAMGFGFERDVCILEFTHRDDGSVTSRLVLDDELASMIHERFVAVDVKVNSRGDIMLVPGVTGTSISREPRAALILNDEASQKLFNVYKANVALARFLVSGGRRVMLSPLENQHKASREDS